MRVFFRHRDAWWRLPSRAGLFDEMETPALRREYRDNALSLFSARFLFRRSLQDVYRNDVDEVESPG
jgi:hypothetical protein